MAFFLQGVWEFMSNTIIMLNVSSLSEALIHPNEKTISRVQEQRYDANHKRKLFAAKTAHQNLWNLQESHIHTWIVDFQLNECKDDQIKTRVRGIL